MSVTYPTTIDVLSNPASTDALNSPSHSDQHSDANDAIEALEAKVGADSSAVATSLDYKVTNTSSSNPGHKHTLADGATDVTSSAAELNKLDGTDATVTDFDKLHDITSSADELNILDGATVTYTELNQLDDVEVGGTTTGDIVTIDDTQTLTNKTLTNPVVDFTDKAVTQNVSFMSRLGSSFTIEKATFTLIPFAEEIWDVGSDYTNTAGNYKFTAPVTGYYLVQAQLAYMACSSLMYTRIYKNGALTYFTVGTGGGGGAECLGLSLIMYLTANDYIQVYGRQNSAGDITIEHGGHTFFGATLIHT
jgi:hypothetical protein